MRLIAFSFDNLDDLVRFHFRVVVGDGCRSRIEIDRSALHAVSLARGMLDLGLSALQTVSTGAGIVGQCPSSPLTASLLSE